MNRRGDYIEKQDVVKILFKRTNKCSKTKVRFIFDSPSYVFVVCYGPQHRMSTS